MKTLRGKMTVIAVLIVLICSSILSIISYYRASKILSKELETNLDKQEIIILNLQRAVQNCVDIGNHILLDYETPTPSTMAEFFKYPAENKSYPIKMQSFKPYASFLEHCNSSV